MSRFCVVEHCSSRSKTDKQLIFFRFPSNFDPGWRTLIQKPIGWVPKPNTRICSLHFRPTDIVGRKLRPGAIPFPADQQDNQRLLIGK